MRGVMYKSAGKDETLINSAEIDYPLRNKGREKEIGSLLYTRHKNPILGGLET